MRFLTTAAIAAAAALLAVPAAAQPAPKPTPEQQAEIRKLQALLEDLHPATGDVQIAPAQAVLHLGKDYYYLPAAEAKRVLVEGWRNPPESAANVLGMVFPAGSTFLDDSWGAVITFDPVGYVSDKDAQSTDYAELLKQLQEGEAEANAARRERGYPAQNLIGWAQHPAYDVRTHSVVWAQNIAFEGSPENTLNYDVRLLGRRGVLSLNMVTGMSKLAETRAAAEKFARSASFESGARYADYQPGTDKTADYGIAGLVAAGVGVAAVKKLGLFGIILAFGKKFIVLILAAVAMIGAWVNRRFLGGGPVEETYEPAYEEAYDPAAYAAAEPTEALPEAPGEEAPRPGGS